MTLHRLLGCAPGHVARFRHHRDNRLPHDVVVVDETSMVSLTMMARLLEAVRPDSPAGAGGRPRPARVGRGRGGARRPGRRPPGAPRRRRRRAAHLAPVRRVASARSPRRVRAGDADAASRCSRPAASTSSSSTRRRARPPRSATAARPRARTSAARPGRRRRRGPGGAGPAAAALRPPRGPLGVRHWNRRSSAGSPRRPGSRSGRPWYAGRPLLVTANDYGLGLYNGDTGVVVRRGRRPAAGARRGQRRPARPRHLPARQVETMHAMTIHKSQGSQADEVTVLLPAADSPAADPRALLHRDHPRPGARARRRHARRRPRRVAGGRQRATGLRQRLPAGRR